MAAVWQRCEGGASGMVGVAGMAVMAGHGWCCLRGLLRVLWVLWLARLSWLAWGARSAGRATLFSDHFGPKFTAGLCVNVKPKILLVISTSRPGRRVKSELLHVAPLATPPVNARQRHTHAAQSCPHCTT